MFSAYLPVFLMLGVAVLVAVGVFALTTVLGPKNMTAEKAIPYESGSETTGAGHIRLSIKFYLTAILFVVFDLGVTLVYAWRKGALEWES
jgi:NADH-quinone oxidoreductase subunit A